MSDIEKVIKGLEYCIADEYCDDCPYTDDCFEIDDKQYGEQLMRDALELLKEQEWQIKNRDESLEKAHAEIKWLRVMLKEQEEIRHGEWKWRHGGECSECGYHNSNFSYKYCPMCGAMMDA